MAWAEKPTKLSTEFYCSFFPGIVSVELLYVSIPPVQDFVFIHQHCSLFVFYYTTVIVVSPLSCYVFYHFVRVPWITIPAVFYMVALVFKVLYFCFLTEELYCLIQNLIHLWLVFRFPPWAAYIAVWNWNGNNQHEERESMWSRQSPNWIHCQTRGEQHRFLG